MNGNDRKFQVWEYTVSHAQLLLRSVRSDEHRTRVDVLFKDVARMSVPTILQLAQIEEAGLDDPLVVAQGLTDAELRDRKVYVLRAEPHDGVVVAGVMVSAEDEGHYYDPSLLLPVLFPAAARTHVSSLTLDPATALVLARGIVASDATERAEGARQLAASQLELGSLATMLSTLLAVARLTEADPAVGEAQVGALEELHRSGRVGPTALFLLAELAGIELQAGQVD